MKTVDPLLQQAYESLPAPVKAGVIRGNKTAERRLLQAWQQLKFPRPNRAARRANH